MPYSKKEKNRDNKQILKLAKKLDLKIAVVVLK